MQPTDDKTVATVQQEVTVLNDELADLRRTLDTLVRYGPSEDVRDFARIGANQLDTIVKNTETLMGSMLTAVKVLKQQRDELIEEAEYDLEETKSEAYDMGYGAAMADVSNDTDDLTNAYNEGAYDQLKRVEQVLGMDIEAAKQHIQEADAALKEWEQWAASTEHAA